MFQDTNIRMAANAASGMFDASGAAAENHDEQSDCVDQTGNRTGRSTFVC